MLSISKQYKNFFKKNPHVDIKTFNLIDEDSLTTLVWKDLDKEVVLPKLRALQRVMRIGVDITTAEALYNEGVHSAHAVAALLKQDFVKQYAKCFKSGKEAAEKFYELASARKSKAMVDMIAIKQQTDPHYRQSHFDNLSKLTDDEFDQLPNYEALFNLGNYCSTSDCRNIFSPAAYFTDLMRMQANYIPVPADPAPPAPYELVRVRRPDLTTLYLNCDNTFTEIPKLTIVNEVLSNTTATTVEQLNTKVYPFNLPFDINFFSLQTYLQQQNTDFSVLWQKFSFPNVTPVMTSSEAALMMSYQQKEVILTPTTSSVALQGYYGLPSAVDIPGQLAPIDSFLTQTGLSHAQLIELLYEDLSDTEIESQVNKDFFINVTIEDEPIGIDTGAAALTYLDPDSHLTRIDRIHRFIRLSKVLNWSFTDLDWAIKTLSIEKAQYIAVGGAEDGDKATILLSDDGINWYIGYEAGDATLNSVAFFKGHSIGVGFNGIIINSTDDGTWNTQTIVMGDATSPNLKAIAGNSDIVFAVGDDGTIISSEDGKTWNTTITSGTENNLNDVKFIPETGEFLAVGDSATILRYVAGAWEVIADPGFDLGCNLRAIYYMNERFITFGYNPTTHYSQLYYSSDAITWMESSISFYETQILNDVAYNDDGQYVLVGYYPGDGVTGYIGTTTDITDSIPSYLPPLDNYILTKALWNKDQYVVVGKDYSGTFYTAILTSNNGTSWAHQFVEQDSSQLYGLSYGCFNANILPGLAWIKTLENNAQFSARFSINWACALLGSVKNQGARSGQTFFESIFSGPNIPNPPAWSESLSWVVPEDNADIPTGMNKQILTALTAALQLSVSDVITVANLIIEAMPILPVDNTLVLDNTVMAILYRFSQLPFLTGLSFAEILVAIDLLNLPTSSSAPANIYLRALAGQEKEDLGNVQNALTSLMSLSQWLQTNNLSVYRLQYWLTGLSADQAITNTIFHSSTVENFQELVSTALEKVYLTETLFNSMVGTTFNATTVVNLTSTVWDNLTYEDDESHQQYINSDGLIIKDVVMDTANDYFVSIFIAAGIEDEDEITSLVELLQSTLNYYQTLQSEVLYTHLAGLCNVTSAMVVPLAEWAYLLDFDESMGTDNSPFYSSLVFLKELDTLPDLAERLKMMQRLADWVSTIGLSTAEVLNMQDLATAPCYNIIYPETIVSGDTSWFNLDVIQTSYQFKKFIQDIQDTQNKLTAYFTWINGLSEPSIDEVAEQLSELNIGKQEDIKFIIDTMWPAILPANSPMATVEGVVLINDYLSQTSQLNLTVQGFSNLVELQSTDPSNALWSETSDNVWSALQKKDQEQSGILNTIQNNILEKIRDAFLDYTIYRLNTYGIVPVGETTPIAVPTIGDANDLYEFLLIDVSVSAAVMTSKIAEGISAVQLFVYRCLNNLENLDGLRISSELQTVWSWMESYRVWRSNRNVFIYPENYIEPELRHNKSSCFSTLENALKQANLTQPSVVNDVFAQYLNTFTQLVNLKIVGCNTYEMTNSDNPIKMVFFVGKTNANPGQYYYRTAVFTTSEASSGIGYMPVQWTPWESITVQVNAADKVNPIYAFGRWYIFWVEQTVQSQSDATYHVSTCYSYLDANANWVNPETVTKVSGALQKDDLPLNNATPVLIDNNLSLIVVAPCSVKTLPSGVDAVFLGSRYIYSDVNTVFNKDKLRYFLSIGQPITPVNTSITNLCFPSYYFNYSTKIPFFKIKGGYTDGYPWQQTVTFWLYVDTLPAANQIIYEVWSNIDTDSHRVFLIQLNSATLTFQGSSSVSVTISAKKWYFITVEIFVSSGGYGTTINAYTTYKDGSGVTQSSQILNQPGLYTLDYEHGAMYLFYGFTPPAIYIENFRIWEGDFIASSTNQSLLKQIFDSTDLSLFKTAPLTLPDFKSALQIFNTTNNIPFTGVFIPNQLDWGLFNYQNEQILVLPYTQAGSTIGYNCIRLNSTAVTQLTDLFFQQGVDGVLSSSAQGLAELPFSMYQPNSTIIPVLPTPYSPTPVPHRPTDTIDFFNSATSDYYWELFFHVPFLMANTLQNQQLYSQAKTWYQYVFNPTIIGADVAINSDDYWQFVGLKAANNPMLDTELNQHWSEEIEYDTTNGPQLYQYHNNPFDPHAIAALRPIAYQKSIVMHYIDNLIKWGDNLFRQYTTASVSEATMLYVMAYDLLGKKPRDLGPCPQIPDTSIEGIENSFTPAILLQDLAEFLIILENYTPPSIPVTWSSTPVNYIEGAYFTLPDNTHFNSYWDTVQKRLYDIRHELNINGIQEPLSLFGVAINSSHGLPVNQPVAQNQPNYKIQIPYYRYSVMIEKAKGVTQMVIQLGQSFLAALEKKDAEQLSLILSVQQQQVYNLMIESQQDQVQATQQTILSLQANLDSAQARVDYYSNLIDTGLSAGELAQLTLDKEAVVLQIGAQPIKVVSMIGYSEPTIVGAADGGYHPGDAINAGAQVLEGLANATSMSAGIAGTMAGYQRRAEDWQLQLTLAQNDVNEITYQIASATAQQSAAEQTIQTLTTQATQQRDIQNFLQSKFTNVQLYQWLIGRLSSLYSQIYKLAYELSVAAQSAWDFERPDLDKTFIQTNVYWNNLYQGLLAGEALAVDLERLDAAYLKLNQRTFEITKIIPLSTLPAVASETDTPLQQLQDSGSCIFTLDYNMFEDDYPGQRCRQIKSISLTFPMILGPYQTLKVLLTQKSSTIYVDTEGHPDPIFINNWNANQQIALSQGVNDAGLFVVNFDDPRYLPFENTGATDSVWQLEFVGDNNPPTDLITDVIIELKYKALPPNFTMSSAAKRLSSTSQKHYGYRAYSMNRYLPKLWQDFLKHRTPLSFNVDQSHVKKGVNDAKITQVAFQWLLTPTGKKQKAGHPFSLLLQIKQDDVILENTELTFNWRGTKKLAATWTPKVPINLNSVLTFVIDVGHQAEMLFNKDMAADLTMMVNYEGQKK